ncbi:DUF6043 family protein [Bacteroides ovatus]|nr:DUF6043 family protein [Bacteroides ovatus]
MAKQDFEQFKQDVKEWLNSHPEEYDRFVAGSEQQISNWFAKGFQIRMETHPSNDA